jgi:NAD dependent epimerase/dehydratase family enzyme
MKNLVAPDQTVINALAEQLKKAKGRPEYQRIQCVLIRATLGSSAAEVARILVHRALPGKAALILRKK